MEFQQIAPGEDVAFPENGPARGESIARATERSFTLAPGTYMVQFALSVSEKAQALLTLNGAELPYTAVGQDCGMSQLSGVALITADTEASVLTVRNPCRNDCPLILTPNAGGAQSVTAHLIITRLQ